MFGQLKHQEVFLPHLMEVFSGLIWGYQYLSLKILKKLKIIKSFFYENPNRNKF